MDINNQQRRIIYSKPRELKTDIPRIVVKDYGILQSDLIDISSWKQRGVKYILTCIDVKSRYAMCRGLTKKSAGLVASSMKDILSRMKKSFPVIEIHTDDGGEYKGPVKRLFDVLKIKHIRHNPKDGGNPTSIIERFNQTLVDKIKIRLGEKHIKKLIQESVDEYNNDKHSTTGCTPETVLPHADDQCIPKEIVNDDYKPIKLFSKVLIRSHPDSMEKKGRRPNWGTTVYEVVERVGYRYLLKDMNGNLHPSKYLKTDLKVLNKNQVDVMMKDVESNIVREYQKVRQSNRTARQVGSEFRGDEVSEIDDQGNVIFKPRLQPKSLTRRPASRALRKYRL